MKQKDVALIGVMAIISAFVSIIASKVFFSSPHNSKQQAEVVDVIDSQFTSPPKKYFNSNSINPTQQIEIGVGQNPNPFKSKQQ